MRVLPEKKPKSQDRPSASRPASRRPELVLLLLLSAQPGPSCLCRGCTRASTHTCRMIQLHPAWHARTPGAAAGSLRMMLSPCGWRFYFLCTCVLPGVLCGTATLSELALVLCAPWALHALSLYIYRVCETMNGPRQARYRALFFIWVKSR